MRILVTNDDGIASEGLWRLAEALKEVGEVVVVAPDRDRSGIAAAMTLLDIVRVGRVRSEVEGVEAYAVQGTPADCVILANGALFDAPFECIFSGINQGANIGADVLLSGTVGAAIHGYLRGIPSVAVSSYFTPGGEVRYAAAALCAAAIARDLTESPVTTPLLLNVNSPDAEPERVRGVEVTVPGARAFTESVERETTGRRSHYWIRHNRANSVGVTDVGADIWAVRNGAASITSLTPLPGATPPAERVQGLADAMARALDAAAPSTAP